MTDSIQSLSQDLIRLGRSVPGIGEKLLQGLCSTQLNLDDPAIIGVLETALNSLQINTSALKQYLAALRNQVEQQVSAGPITFNVVDSQTQANFQIVGSGNETIDELNQRISQMLNVPTSNYQLMTNTGYVLNKSQLLSQIPTDLIIIPLVGTNKTISVKPIDKNPISISLPNMAKVAQLRQAVNLRTGVPLENIRLIYAGKQLADTDNVYDIKGQLTMLNLPSIKEITVRNLLNRDIQLSLPANTTVNELKQEVSRSMGVPAERLRLIYNSRPLADTENINQINDIVYTTLI